MIRILFVGDGPADEVTTPPLVRTILEREDVRAEARAWARLHAAGRGYDRKLLFALRAARAGGLSGVVATIDQDRSAGRERLRSLEAARVRDRQTDPPLPAALGCADPHAEAWLLDDPVAVRSVLRLPGDARVPKSGTSTAPRRRSTACTRGVQGSTSRSRSFSARSPPRSIPRGASTTEKRASAASLTRSAESLGRSRS